LPPAAIRGPDGKPLLSWRVALLPYAGQEFLYKMFKFDEPWDSEHNKRLTELMPSVYRGPYEERRGPDRTPFLAVVGRDTVFPSNERGITLKRITDGLDHTIAVVEAKPDRAVIWTRPDELELDPERPLEGLARKDNEPFLALFCDGTVQTVSSTVDPKALLRALRRNDGEPPTELTAGGQPREAEVSPLAGSLLDFLPLNVGRLSDIAEIEPHKLRRFILDGLGDRIAVNVHDSARVFDLDWPSLARGGLGWEVRLGLWAQLLTSPVSVAIPVKDAKVVDEFLGELDRAPGGFSLLVPAVGNFKPDGYRTKTTGGHVVRCMVVRGAGLKWRVFLGRIGDGLYVVNRPQLLEEIAAAEAERARKPADDRPADRDAVGHALLRLRPENWDQVLPDFRLSWAEADREACTANLVALTNVARGWHDRRKADAEKEVEGLLLEQAARLYGGARPYCPEGGRYTLSADGRSCRCSVHGDATVPRQPASPGEDSTSGRAMRSFAGLTATLTFLEDGLRAVVILDRK
jgi:hypothetical protein